MTTELNVQMEFINYTWDEVFYYEDLTDGSSDLEIMFDEHPECEIGVTHFSVNGITVPYNDENVSYLLANPDMIDVVIIADALGMDMTDLKDTEIDIECYHSNYYFHGSNVVDCFEQLMDEIELFTCPDFIKPYIDYEKLLRDYELSGMTVIDMPDGYTFIF